MCFTDSRTGVLQDARQYSQVSGLLPEPYSFKMIIEQASNILGGKGKEQSDLKNFPVHFLLSPMISIVVVRDSPWSSTRVSI
jgi:hypothetical protein